MKALNICCISIITLFLSCCSYRTPSKVRFEKITGIELSDSITVIEDRFEESGNDYGLYYKISIPENVCVKISDDIKKSKNWERTRNVWRFNKTIDGIRYDIIFSIDECKISYSESLI